jgi:hypothetical protein
MWWERAKPGDKVVCIDGASGTAEVGKVYTILDVQFSELHSWKECHVYFDIGSIHPCGQKWFVCASCFKPAQPKSTETGMKMLRRLLTRERERA